VPGADAYALRSDSRFRQRGTDHKDPGVDVSRLLAATKDVVVAAAPPTP